MLERCTPSRYEESTAQWPPEFSTDGNCQNAAVSEMAGKAGRAVKPRAVLKMCPRPAANKGTSGNLGRRERNNGGG